MLESGENYLETILRLTQKNGNVRSVDVAEALGVTKPSVSRAMSILREQGYVLFAESNRLVLTEKGRAKAEAVYERHRVISRFLMLSLDVDEALAAKDACRFEHDISDETFERMKAYVRAHGAQKETL